MNTAIARDVVPIMTQRLVLSLAVCLAVFAGPACDVRVNDKGLSFDVNEGGRAEDEWTRTYSVQKGGRLELRAENGNIDVGPAAGSVIELRAKREVRARSDEAAQQLLKELQFIEEVTPDQVRIESARAERKGGLRQAVTIHYVLSLPPGLSVTLRTENGNVRLDRVNGLFAVGSTNGTIFGRSLSGGLEANTVNGAVNVQLAGITSDVGITTVNGPVFFSLPEKFTGSIEADTVNGGIVLNDGVPLSTTDRERRHLSGRFGTGSGPHIVLRATNGGVRIGVGEPPK